MFPNNKFFSILYILVATLQLRALVNGLTAESTCYDYDGKEMDSDFPCNPSASHSFCCGPYFVCLDSGICSSQNTSDLTKQDPAFVRGSCTDKSWKSSHCPQFCIGDAPSGDPCKSLACGDRGKVCLIVMPDGRIMIACDKSSLQGGSFCWFGDPCTDGGKCLPEEGKLLSFGNQTAETTISIGESTTYGLVSPTTATFAPVVDSSSGNSAQRTASQTLSSSRRISVSFSLSISSDSSSRLSSLQTRPAAQTTISSSATGPAASATQSSLPQPSAPNNTPMKVGIGFRVTGGVALLAAIAFIFWWRRRQSHPKSAGDTDRVEAPTSPSHPSHQIYGFPSSELGNTGKFSDGSRPSELGNTKKEKISELNNEGAQFELPMPEPRRPQELPTIHSPG